MGIGFTGQTGFSKALKRALLAAALNGGLLMIETEMHR
jgi:hypothetical protein